MNIAAPIKQLQKINSKEENIKGAESIQNLYRHYNL